MNLYKTTISPLSTFATAFQGDTLFGQLCWAIKYSFGEERLEQMLNSYGSHPFLIVSDGFASGYVPKPSMPTALLSENMEDKKKNRKRRWLTLQELQNGNFTQAKTDSEIGYINKTASVVKNSINYKTFTTGDEGFDPYSENETALSKHDIYFLIDENLFSKDDLQIALRTVSLMGYGKNSSIGKGRFDFSDFVQVSLENRDSNSYMTLSHCSLEGVECKEVFYEPITKFAKHGADLATSLPFKKPLLLVKSGSVVIFNKTNDIQYIGKALQGHSSHAKTVHQGYSIVIPINGVEL